MCVFYDYNIKVIMNIITFTMPIIIINIKSIVVL